MASGKPDEPSEEDCCHNGCTNCVFDIYASALRKWVSEQCLSKQFRYDLLSQTRFKPFVLVKVSNIAANTNLYVLKPQIQINENLEGFLPYDAGQHLSLRINLGTFRNASPDSLGYPYLIRNYSIISLAQEKNDCTFEVLIKLYERSVTSDFIDKLQVGDITYWRGPYGDYKYHPNKYSNLIILCMGTGIAPMYPIIKEILYNEKDETVIKLLYGCRNSSEIILRKELGEFRSYWNFKCNYYLSEECHLGNKLYNEEFVLGRISLLDISEAIHDKVSCFFLICGSSNFIKDMKKSLRKLNISEDMFHIF